MGISQQNVIFDN